MGEYAEMMLDGTLCEGCGEFLGSAEDEPAGYPMYCYRCRRSKADNEKVPCPKCNKNVKQIGMKQHLKDKHGIIKE